MIKPVNNSNLVALVDADILVFRCCFRGEYKIREIYHVDDLDDPVACFRYVKDVKQWLSNGISDPTNYLIRNRPVLDDVSVAIAHADKKMRDISSKFTGAAPILYLSGSDNFRESIATIAPYKGNRWTDEKRGKVRAEGNWLDFLTSTQDNTRVVRPAHEAQVKQHLVDNWGAVYSVGEEADDLLLITQANMCNNRNGLQGVVVSIDKDLKMGAGYHQSLTDLDDDVEYIDKSQGLLNFYQQMLTGDSVDNIKGIKGVGVKGAAKLLKGLTNEVEMFEVVHKKYTKSNQYFGQDIDAVLLEIGRLLKIRQYEGEMWEPPR